jgi:predicted nucleotidyltransferase
MRLLLSSMKASVSSICGMPIMGSKMPIMGRTAKVVPVRRRSPRAQRRSQVPSKASLADALFTSTQQRVLGLLYGQPQRSFFATELIGLARSGSGAVQRELARLVASGLVTVVPVGNQKHYRANAEAPIFEELYGIILKTVGLEGPLRNALDALGPRIRLALIYGSVAKGEDRATSDVDLLLLSDDVSLEEVFAALAPLEAQLARPVRPTLYTSKEFHERLAKGNTFLQRVLAGPHRVLIGTLDGATGTR